MRYLKVPGITIRIPLQSIESSDFIMTTWKDPEQGFERASNLLRAKIERLSEWGTHDLNGRTIHYIKIKIIDFWTPLPDDMA